MNTAASPSPLTRFLFFFIETFNIVLNKPPIVVRKTGKSLDFYFNLRY